MNCNEPIELDLIGSVLQGPPGTIKSSRAILGYLTKAEAVEAAKTLPDDQLVNVEDERKHYRVKDGALVFIRNFIELDLESNSGASFIGWVRNLPSAIATTISRWLARQNCSLHDFMTEAQIADSLSENPVMDHTVAIQNWLSKATKQNSIYLPAGKFRFNSPLFTPVTDIKIYGEGRRKSVFQYFGPVTNIDLFTVGNGVDKIKPFLSGFSVDSSTKMTGGTAIRLKRCTNGFTVRDVSPGKPVGEYMLWDGIWFDNVNVGNFIESECGVQGEAIIVNGKQGSDEGSDLFIDKVLILAGTTQIHMAGGFGGLNLGQVICYGGKVNVLVDQARVKQRNRELLLSSSCVLDAADEALLRVNDEDGQVLINCDAWLSGGGFFNPAPGYGIDIIKTNGGTISIGSGAVKGSTSHGIHIQDPTTNVFVSDKTLLAYNQGFGAYSTAYTTRAKINAQMFANTAGNVSGYIDSREQAGQGAVSTSGTIGSYTGVMRYSVQSGICTVAAEITITDNGTGDGAILFAIPFPIKKSFVGTGACLTSGKQVFVRGEVGNGAISIQKFDGSYPGGNGETIRIHYNYEIQN